MRFKVATLLALVALLGVIAALGLQVRQRTRQLAEVQYDLKQLKWHTPQLEFAWPVSHVDRGSNRGVEGGMKASEWQLQQRRLQRVDVDSRAAPAAEPAPRNFEFRLL